MTSTRSKAQIVPVVGLIYRFELGVRHLNEDIPHLLDLEGWLPLFLNVALDPYWPFKEERVTDFTTDLMQFDIERDDADKLFRDLLRRTKRYMEHVTGERIGISTHDWKWLNREHTAIVLIDKY